MILQESYQNLITDDGFSNDDFVLTVDGKSFAVLMEHFSSLMPRICIKGTGRFKYHLHHIFTMQTYDIIRAILPHSLSARNSLNDHCFSLYLSRSCLVMVSEEIVFMMQLCICLQCLLEWDQSRRHS